MDTADRIFAHKAVNYQKSENYGFCRDEKGFYIYHTVLSGSGFVMNVTVSEEGAVAAEIVDPAFDEPYTLHLTGGAGGSFVGGVKEEYERTLRDISEKCFQPDIFRAEQTREAIAYVRSVFGDEPEYLWKKFPDNAVWRRRDNRKWYGVLLKISKRKLGIESDDIVEIIDLRLPPERMESLIDRKVYFPGWHMNKKHWYTMILDGSVERRELFRRIDESYRLAVK